MTNDDHLSSNPKTLEREKGKIYGEFIMELERYGNFYGFVEHQS